MKCTKCGGEFKAEKFKGVKIDKCSDCKSIWLDNNELDQLEDTVWDEDELKGSLFLGSEPSKIQCPKCGKMMKKIKYRFYDLELETCPDSHGFYLDAGEEKRILELVKIDKEADKRKVKSEEHWAGALKRLKTKSFFDKLKTFLQG